jgi:hypothetical protein
MNVGEGAADEEQQPQLLRTERVDGEAGAAPAAAEQRRRSGHAERNRKRSSDRRSVDRNDPNPENGLRKRQVTERSVPNVQPSSSLSSDVSLGLEPSHAGMDVVTFSLRVVVFEN